MSVPTPDFDQLLSDHLDGWLEGDDLKLIEAKLRDDPATRTHYETLLADRSFLRQSFQQASSASDLPDHFASQVLSIANERLESIATTLPLSTSARWTKRAVIAAVVSTAAAVMLFASISSRVAPDVQVAENQVGQNRVAQNKPAALSMLAVAEADSVEEAEINETELKEVPNLELALADAEVHKSESMSPQGVHKVAPELESVAISVDSMRGAESTRGISPAQEADISSAVSVIPIDDNLFAGAVLVYDIQLTTQGRVSRSVAKAMDRVGMAETSRQPIDRALVEAAESVESFDEDAKFQILYLRAPAKKLDRLFASLLNDQKGVSSVGLSLVTDSPILKLTDNLEKVDPTEIRHDDSADRGQRAVSLDLQLSQQKELAVLRRLLDDETFMPMTRKENPLSPVAQGSGRDVMSRVLVIIR